MVVRGRDTEGEGKSEKQDEEKGSQREERERQHRGDSAQRGLDKGRENSETRRRRK